MLSGLQFEVANSIRRNEESADGSIRFVRPEVAVLAIKPDHAIRALRLQNVPARMAVAQLLGEMQIMIAGDLAEIMAVFIEVVLQQICGAEALATRQGCSSACQQARSKDRISNA